MDCKHDQRIAVLKMKRGWKWSCADCGHGIAKWDDVVWEAIVGEGLDVPVGEGFILKIVSKDA